MIGDGLSLDSSYLEVLGNLLQAYSSSFLVLPALACLIVFSSVLSLVALVLCTCEFEIVTSTASPKHTCSSDHAHYVCNCILSHCQLPRLLHMDI